MKKITLILLCLTVLLALFVSCADGRTGEYATARFSINNERSRTFGSDWDTASVTKYRFQLDHISNSSVSYTYTFDRQESGTYVINGILPGQYSLTASGLNSSDTVLTTTERTLYLTRGDNSFTLTFSQLSGTGNIAIDLVWHPGAFSNGSNTITPTIEVKLTSQNGTVISGVSVDSAKISEGKARITKSGVKSGSYILEVSIKGNDQVFFGSVEVIRVTPESNAEGTIDYSKSGLFDQSLKVIDHTSPSITGTISADKNYKKGDKKQGATTFTLNYTNLPEGKTAEDVKVRWFGEHIEIAGGHGNTVSFSPFSGTARYTAVMWIEGIEGSMGSTEIEYYCP